MTAGQLSAFVRDRLLHSPPTLLAFGHRERVKDLLDSQDLQSAIQSLFVTA
jgi:hypothetical protein